MFTITLESHQIRSITVQCLANNMIIMKQYMDRSEIDHYKFVLGRVATMIELAEIQDKFDKAWPSDVKWDC